MTDSFFTQSASRRATRVVLGAFLLFAFAAPTRTMASVEQAGGVPSLVLLSVGFGEKFNDEKFININGMGALGLFEFWSSDVWFTSGVYANVALIGDLIDKDKPVGKADPNNLPTGADIKDGDITAVRDAPPGGFAFGPGLALGFTIGAIPYFDIHLLGTIGAEFALLTRYQHQTKDGKESRVKVKEMDAQVGYSYGGIAAVAYTGSNPWLNGLTLGVEGGYHKNTFDRWHLGVSVGFSF